MRAYAAVVLFCILIASPASAMSEEAAAKRCSVFLRALLLDDAETARQYTTADVQPWIEMLLDKFPGSFQEKTHFEIMDVAMGKSDRRCIARVERGSTEELYYIDFEDDEVAHVYTVFELGARHEEKIRAGMERLSEAIASWNAGDSKPRAVAHEAGDYISIVDDLRDEINWYVKWLKYNKPPPGKSPNYGSFSAQR
jgi:hypothetical protein